jgi:16S rRNA (adenine1518-N6/adenine1519-N6)-dimethyltransferase
MLEIKAKKKFGQNFLKDESVLIKIIESMPKNKNHLVEIGPGLGDLTKKLVKYKDVTAYEVDRDLYAILRVEFSTQIESKKLDLVLTDVLKVWENGASLHDNKYDLVANLPYYIATNIILKAFDDDNCENIIVMVQKEVADKFVASCKDKEFSSLGVMSTLLCEEREILVEVPPTSFNPPPKVDSSVIWLRKNMTSKVSIEFKAFLKVVFTQPRKTLVKNLAARYAKSEVVEVIKSLNIKELARPHEVEASLYSQIYSELTK